MNKKKILVLAMALSMVAILAIGGSIAYFTAEDNAENVFTVGNVQIDLTEPNWEAQGEDEAADAYPGEALAKDPTVENTGANPCFVRIKVTGLNILQIHSLSAQLIKIRNSEYALDAVNAGWTLHEELNENGTIAYIYYNTVLPAGETTTTPAFSHIVIPADTTNEGSGEPLTVNVQAQAVQAQGAQPSWSAVQSMTVDQIAAWFAECGL